MKPQALSTTRNNPNTSTHLGLLLFSDLLQLLEAQKLHPSLIDLSLAAPLSVFPFSFHIDLLAYTWFVRLNQVVGAKQLLELN